MWILGSFTRDFCFFYLPGFLAVAASRIEPNLANSSIVFALFATGLVDSGHVYTTAWRTLFHPSERKSRNGYWAVPLTVAVFFTAWAYFQIPYLWSVVVYSTVFHYIRQIYGFTKWTQVLNKRICKTSDFFIYALSILPAIAYHFRFEMPSSYYSPGDILFFPNLNLLGATLFLYSLTFTSWVAFELTLWRKGLREYSRILSIFCTTLLWTFCFILGTTQTQILIPLIFSHGVPYMAVLSQSLTRTQTSRFKAFLPTLAVVVTTALLLGAYTEWMEEIFVDFGSNLNPAAIGFQTAMIIGFYLTPLYSHFIFDAWIWKRAHRESGLVYQTPIEEKDKAASNAA